MEHVSRGRRIHLFQWQHQAAIRAIKKGMPRTVEQVLFFSLLVAGKWDCVPGRGKGMAKAQGKKEHGAFR